MATILFILKKAPNKNSARFEGVFPHYKIYQQYITFFIRVTFNHFWQPSFLNCRMPRTESEDLNFIKVLSKFENKESHDIVLASKKINCIIFISNHLSYSNL